MDIHENARTTRHGRMPMIERLHAGWSVAAVADTLGVTAKTVRIGVTALPRKAPLAWPNAPLSRVAAPQGLAAKRRRRSRLCAASA